MRQKLNHTRQQLNLTQSTVAKLVQVYINAHIDTKKTPPVEDESSFLPYPAIWLRETFVPKLNLKPSTALEILNHFDKLPSDHQAMLDTYLLELKFTIR